ncbi:hypothetical protein D3C74_335620 [compost metagenome]
MVLAEGSAVHLVRDEDLGSRIGDVVQRQGADEVHVLGVGVGEHRGQVVGAVIGALEPHVDAVVVRPRLCQHLVQQSTLPAGGRDGVVAPWLTGGQWTHLEASVAGALERDRAFVRGEGTKVLEREGQRVLHRAADLEPAVVLGQREVAAHVVELGRGDLLGERRGRRLRVVRGRVDHLQRGARTDDLVGNRHCSASS